MATTWRFVFVRYLVVFTPPTREHFCVEPVSHVNNAIHMSDPIAHGIVALAALATQLRTARQFLFLVALIWRSVLRAYLTHILFASMF